MFNKKERSSFPYWFAHWCAYQMVALNYNCWKPKYLLHDWYKPWLKLILPYEMVSKFHKTHSHHHLQNKYHKYDYEAMVIDWECSRLTKEDSPLNARQYINTKHSDMIDIFYPILEKMGL